MRSISFLVLAGWLGTAALAAGDPLTACRMEPAHLSMGLPEHGFTWLSGGDHSGSCDAVPAKGWSRKAAGPGELLVHTEGPEGSGRYWTLTVGMTAARRAAIRGFCLTTSTLGWRTLQKHSKGALPWREDLDGDGSAELIVWGSFPLHDDESMAEHVLVAWAYRRAEDELRIDWDLSRALARSLAQEYRAALEPASGHLKEIRAQAAAALEGFAEGRCRPASSGQAPGPSQAIAAARSADPAGREVVAVVERLERHGFKRWTTDHRVEFMNVVAFAVVEPRRLPNMVSAYIVGHPTAGERPLLLGDRVTFVLPADYDDRILSFSQLGNLRLAQE